MGPRAFLGKDRSLLTGPSVHVKDGGACGMAEGRDPRSPVVGCSELWCPKELGQARQNRVVGSD